MPASDLPAVPTELARSLDRVAEEVEELVEGHSTSRSGFAWGVVAMVLVVGYGLSSATMPWILWLAPAVPLVSAGVGWWTSREERDEVESLADGAAGPSLRLAVLRARLDEVDAGIGAGIDVGLTSITKWLGWLEVVTGGAFAVIFGLVWALGDEPVATLGLAVLGVGMCAMGGLFVRRSSRQGQIDALGAELARLSRELDRSPRGRATVELRERIAAQNELDELRQERRRWMGTVAFGVPAVGVWQYLRGGFGDPLEVVLLLTFSVVVFGVLGLPVLRSRDRIRELEDRLEELDAGGGSGVRAAPAVPEGGRVASPVAVAATEKGGDEP